MGLGDGIGQKKPCHHLGPFFFSTGKNFGLPKRIFEKKIEKCKKGDEITRFDGTFYSWKNPIFIKIAVFFIPRPPWRTSKLQEKPLALRREHRAFQNIKITSFSVFGGHFSSPGSGFSRPKPMRIHVDPDPYPQHWSKNSFSVVIHSNVPGTEIVLVNCNFCRYRYGQQPYSLHTSLFSYR